MKEIKEMKEFLGKYNLLPVFEVVTEGQRAKQPKVKWTEKENRIFDPEKLTKVGYTFSRILSFLLFLSLCFNSFLSCFVYSLVNS